MSLPVNCVLVAFEQTVDCGDCGGGRRRVHGTGRRRVAAGDAASSAGRVRAGERGHGAGGRRVRAVGRRARQSGGRLQRQAAAMVTGARRRVVDGAGDAVNRRVMARHLAVVLKHTQRLYVTTIIGKSPRYIMLQFIRFLRARRSE